MIHVIASVRVKAGRTPDFLEIFKANMVRVKEESGCIDYFPAVDVDAQLPPQVLDENTVTIIERWEDLMALHDHLGSPGMLAYKEKVSGIVESVSLRILKET